MGLSGIYAQTFVDPTPSPHGIRRETHLEPQVPLWSGGRGSNSGQQCVVLRDTKGRGRDATVTDLRKYGT